ncbi:hypothetical protein ACFYSW_29135 [Rhodococcus aetherivorans]|uniref:hypothetical protein n=1 Tax=Rhodococcus aetherivorans TaxID=191292 RepID=UPI003681235D
MSVVIWSGVALRGISVGVAMAFVALVPACGDSQTEASSGSSAVTDQGMDLTVGGTRAQAPPSVADQGTPVVLSTSDTSELTALSERTQRIGKSISLTLGDPERRVQPRVPIRVSTMANDAVSVNGLLPLAATHGLSGQPELLEATYDATQRTVYTELPHLSPLDFFTIDFRKLAGGIWSSAAQLIAGENPSPPACVGRSVQLDGVTYRASRMKVVGQDGDMNGVWPCLRASNGRILLDLQANGNRAWLALTDPNFGPGQSVGASGIDSAAQGMYSSVKDLHFWLGQRNKNPGTLMPGGTLTYSFPASYPPRRAEVKADAGLLLTAGFLFEMQALAQLFGIDPGGVMGRLPETYDCIVGAADLLDTEAANFEANVASMFRVELDCMGAVATGPMAFLLSAVGGGVGLISGFVTGAVQEALGKNHGYTTITASRHEPATDRPMDARMQYLDTTWGGHGTMLRLYPDWTGTLSLFSGAMSGEEWSLHWQEDGPGWIIVLEELNRSVGSGAGAAAGERFRVIPEHGVYAEALHVTGPIGAARDRQRDFWVCGQGNGFEYTPECGA